MDDRIITAMHFEEAGRENSRSLLSSEPISEEGKWYRPIFLFEILVATVS